MLAYVASSLSYLFYKEPTYVNTDAIDNYDELEYAHTSTLLDILTRYVPRLNGVLVNNCDDKEFITQVIDIIGLDRYSKEIDHVITSLCVTDIKVDVISSLVSYADITKLDINMTDNPFLGHLLKLPITYFDEYGDMSSDALQWFLSIYNPETLYRLVSHTMTYVSKELQQQLLDIVIRDCKYLNSERGIGHFVASCIYKGCDISKCKVLYPFLTRDLCAIIQYSIDGSIPKNKDIDLAYSYNGIWDTDIGKSFFTAYADDDMKVKLKSKLGHVINTNLSKLLD